MMADVGISARLVLNSGIVAKIIPQVQRLQQQLRLPQHIARNDEEVYRGTGILQELTTIQQ